MDSATKRPAIFTAVAVGLALVGIVLAIGLLASARASISGTASLPGGATARIKGPFTCSERAGITEIEAGGHVFTFSPTTISMDGAPVGSLDATVTDVQIDARFGSASLRVNGHEISTPR
ncbi:MAG: hypothetical protein DWQ37_13170 [Planctomycetota bacterium]|nr:MAG: hypothetical protein DWQ37_13170 [Planctomycetota bacterium]